MKSTRWVGAYELGIWLLIFMFQRHEETYGCTIRCGWVCSSPGGSSFHCLLFLAISLLLTVWPPMSCALLGGTASLRLLLTLTYPHPPLYRRARNCHVFVSVSVIVIRHRVSFHLYLCPLPHAPPSLPLWLFWAGLRCCTISSTHIMYYYKRRILEKKVITIPLTYLKY